MPRRKTAPQETLHPGQVGDYWPSQKSNSPYWHRTWYDPRSRQTKRQSLGLVDFHAAQAALVEWVGKNGIVWTDTDPKNVKLVEVLNWYYQSHADKLAAGRVIRGSLAYWVQFFAADTVIADLKRHRIDAFVEHHRKLGHSEGYIGRILADGRSAIKRAERYELVDRAPFIPSYETSEEIAERRPKGRPLALTEMATLLLQPWPDHLQVFIGILLNTGCRPRAALDLARPQIDFEHNLADLNPKGRRQTKKRRPIIPMTPSLKRLLIAVERMSCDTHASDFEMGNYVTFHDKPILDYFGSFRRIARGSGLPACEEISAYSFRHTIARELRKASVDTEQISVLLGHRPRGVSMTTGIYAPYEPDYLLEAARAIEAYVQRLNVEMERQLRTGDSVSVRSIPEHIQLLTG